MQNWPEGNRSIAFAASRPRTVTLLYGSTAPVQEYNEAVVRETILDGRSR